MSNEKNNTKIMPEYSDAELVAEYGKKRSQWALAELFVRYRKPFYAYLNRMLNNDSMSADDVFQELWIRIMKKLPECRNHENFAGWGFAIAHNLVMEHYRKLACRRKIGSETVNGELPEPEITEEPMAAEYEEYRKRKLDEAILNLPPEQKEVVELRRSGISFKAIAAIQNCPVNTALGRMHKAVKALKADLQKTE